MPKKMPAEVLAQILWRDFREGGAKAADQCCEIIEQLHGRRKLDLVLDELALMLEIEADEGSMGGGREWVN
jgi:hypothetical protein